MVAGLHFDAVIVGAGIAGASLAAFLAPQMRIALVEAEPVAGYHATGRSAAFWEETYGGPGVQPLTRASRAFLAAPPPDFADSGFLSPRGALYLADEGNLAAARAWVADQAGRGVDIGALDRAGAAALVPGLAAQWRGAAWLPGCCDIDVARLHAAFLAQARRAGARVVLGAALTGANSDGAGWRLTIGGDTLHAGLLVNAAGAWADDVARLAGVPAIGITPMRRTMVQVRLAEPLPPDMPLTLAFDGSFYVKRQAGGCIWLTPHDETPAAAGDAAAEELDVALALDRLGRAFDWRVVAAERRWAGLRSFAADRLPVIGHDPAAPGFFWFAGQGGWGIQTAPAAALLAAAQIRGSAAVDVDAAPYLPERFRGA